MFIMEYTNVQLTYFERKVEFELCIEDLLPLYVEWFPTLVSAFIVSNPSNIYA
jgi:hypothetical protein